jgi:hypothetical protein|tara:strand:- start:34 stop:375 length:342 start_codon:yes stop_codon:yes gene_type:complete
MPTTLTFTNPLNVSCQVGDTAYFVPTSSLGGYNINSAGVVEIGIITAISGLVITVANNLVATVPNGSFILFSKDNKANQSSALGYFAEIKMKNNSTVVSELFSVGVDTFESSK